MSYLVLGQRSCTVRLLHQYFNGGYASNSVTSNWLRTLIVPLLGRLQITSSHPFPFPAFPRSTLDGPGNRSEGGDWSYRASTKKHQTGISHDFAKRFR